MTRLIFHGMPILLGLLFFCNTAGAENGGCRNAVAAYDAGEYKRALDLAERAVSRTPDDPRCNHLAGKACIKLERYGDALPYLIKAWERDKNLPGLISDIAFLKYKMSDFQSAAILFEGIVANEPNSIAARYYMGVCGMKTGQMEKAKKMFAYVRDHAEDEKVRKNAEAWLKQIIGQGANKQKKWRLHLKAGYQYDDNVRFEPLDLDIYDEEGDDCAVGGFYGKYDLWRAGGFAGGIGYGHYQTWHTDLSEYDAMAMMGSVYSTYRAGAFSFGLKYLPAYYAMDSERYLTKHNFCPEILWHVDPHLITGMSFGYSDNDYKSDDRDGNTFETVLNLHWGFGEKSLFSATAGYEDTTASAANEAFNRFKAGMGVRFDLFESLTLGLKGEYAKKTHDGADPESGQKREDDRYAFHVSAEHGLFYEWLGIMAEYDYARNKSEVDLYDYSRQKGTISVTMDF